MTEASEREARIRLAAVYRVLAHWGVEDLISNYVALRVPGQARRMLIKPMDFMPCEVTASTLLEYELDGTPTRAGDPALTGGALVIHGGLLAARADLNVVFHTHTPATIAVASQRWGLLPVCQHALCFEELRLHEFRGFEFEPAMTGRLLDDLAGAKVALLRNHGVLVCGATLEEAFLDHYMLEMACRAQIAALSAGREHAVLIEGDVVTRARGQIAAVRKTAPAGHMEFGAALRLAYRLDPGFAQ
jgi:ribulose-5-phosphate 4-epimerase/fuculose-1-phosphate aldolase